MTLSTYHERLDERVAAQTGGRTPIWLRTEPEHVQYQILAEIISAELENIVPRFKPVRSPPLPIPRSALQYRQYPKVFP